MAFIVEDGSGRVDSNAYITPEWATVYLRDRNREQQNAWLTRSLQQQQAAIIHASQFLDDTKKFLGVRGNSNYPLQKASACFTASGVLAEGETLTVGSTVYHFTSTLTVAFDVLIGASVTDTLTNLIAAVNQDLSGLGTQYAAGTSAHPTFEATFHQGSATILQFDALVAGRDANNAALATDAVNGSWDDEVTKGGTDLHDRQGLEFPRVGLVTRDGHVVTGIPDLLKRVTAEYAVRAVGLKNQALLPDPTQAEQQGTVTKVKKKLDTMETEYTYGAAASQSTLSLYPLADKMIADFIASSGAVIR